MLQILGPADLLVPALDSAPDGMNLPDRFRFWQPDWGCLLHKSKGLAAWGTVIGLRQTLDINDVDEAADVLWPVSNYPRSEALDLAIPAYVVLLNPVTSAKRIAGQTGEYPQQLLAVAFLRR